MLLADRGRRRPRRRSRSRRSTSATPRRGETTRLESGGLFIFIGADAETAWLPPEIALDRRGYVLTGADVRAAGRWELDRDPYLLETSVAVGEGSMAVAFVHQYVRDAESRA